MKLLFSLWIKLFFVFTPFFALTMFLFLTEGFEHARRRRLAIAVSTATAVICLILFFVGRQLFSVFGITLDSFRVGAGMLLFLSGIGLARGQAGTVNAHADDDVVVPLAIPIIVGPATTGTLLVLGAEMNGFAERTLGMAALALAILSVAGVLRSGTAIQRILGMRGIAILSRLTA